MLSLRGTVEDLKRQVEKQDFVDVTEQDEDVLDLLEQEGWSVHILYVTPNFLITPYELSKTLTFVGVTDEDVLNHIWKGAI